MLQTDEIIEMARQADAYADAMDVGGKNYIGLRDEYFAKLVASAASAKEREACAKVCEGFEGQHRYIDDIVEAIRARGETT